MQSTGRTKMRLVSLHFPSLPGLPHALAHSPLLQTNLGLQWPREIGFNVLSNLGQSTASFAGDGGDIPGHGTLHAHLGKSWANWDKLTNSSIPKSKSKGPTGVSGYPIPLDSGQQCWSQQNMLAPITAIRIWGQDVPRMIRKEDTMQRIP